MASQLHLSLFASYSHAFVLCFPGKSKQCLSLYEKNKIPAVTATPWITEAYGGWSQRDGISCIIVHGSLGGQSACLVGCFKFLFCSFQINIGHLPTWASFFWISDLVMDVNAPATWRCKGSGTQHTKQDVNCKSFRNLILGLHIDLVYIYMI